MELLTDNKRHDVEQPDEEVRRDEPVARVELRRERLVDRVADAADQDLENQNKFLIIDHDCSKF